MNKEIISSAQNQTMEMLDKLNRSCVLNKDECDKLIQDIDYIQSLACKDICSSNLDVEALFSQFTINAKVSGDMLKTMLEVITQGKVPDGKLVKDLDKKIDDLRSDYEKVVEAANQLIPDDEMPDKGSAAQDYVEAVKNSASLRYKQQISKAKACLTSFLAVRALADVFAEALQPYQNEIADKLSDIDSGSTIDPNELLKITEGPEKFLAAISCEDANSAESLDLLDELPSYYINRVCVGVSKGQYYVDEDISHTYDTFTSHDKPGSSDSSAEHSPDSVVTIPEELESQDEKDSPHAPDEPQAEESSLVKTLKATDFLIKTFPSLNISKSPAEDKKISATIFTNEIRKSDVSTAKYIIVNLYHNYATSVENLSTVSDASDININAELDYLYKKGYLRKYSLEAIGEIYGVSPRLRKALTYKESSKFIGVRQIKDENDSVALEIPDDDSLFVSAVYAFSRDFAKALANETSKGNKTGDVETFYIGNSYISSFGDPEEDGATIITGAFWNSFEEADEYLKKLRYVKEKQHNIKRIVISCLDYERTALFADTLSEFYGDILENTSILLAPLMQEGYFPYPPDDASKEITSKKVCTDLVSAPSDEIESKLKDSTTDEVPAAIISTEPIEEAQYLDSSDKSTPAPKEAPTPPIINESKSVALKAEATTLQAESYTSVKENVCYFINEHRIYAACAYLNSCSGSSSDNKLLYDMLAYAVNDPMAHCSYSTENIFDLINVRGNFEDALTVSAALRTFFSNQKMYDYNIKSFYMGIKDYAVLNHFSALNAVVYALMNFKNDIKMGMDAYADYHSKNRLEIEAELKAVANEARDFYDNFILGKKKEKANFRRFIETKKLMLSQNGELGELVRAVAENDTDMYELVEYFLKTNFFDEGSMIAIDTIDEDMLWNYIEVFWDKAGENMMLVKHHTDLKSSLRSNIISITNKAVQLMVRWYILRSEEMGREEDDGAVEYKRVRTPLLKNLEIAINDINNALTSDDISLDLRAGYIVLLDTLTELRACIQGKYNEHERAYFYSPFLLTDHLMLDDNFLPDFDVHGSTLESLNPCIRIVAHVNSMTGKPINYAQCLNNILNDGTDNYGRAELLLTYLNDHHLPTGLEDAEQTIESSINFARQDAKGFKESFIGELELAQSNGQIDNSVEDMKDKILHVVKLWYEWAEETSNYGFFKKILDGYLISIKKSAKSRENDLLSQLEIIKNKEISEISLQEKKIRIEKINNAIKAQNYTVAEDMLSRIHEVENEHDELLDEDFLSDFIDNYSDYYGPVSSFRSNFTTLVTKHARNKEQRGAKRLADYWLPGGSDLGADNLTGLLSALGFSIGSISPRARIGNKFENYIVKTEARKGGNINYSHPIAAFGSGAAIDGFRVVCINGNYEAKALIDIMKTIGTSNHTLILLDSAMSLSERRLLARKAKNSLGVNLIAVLDRTVMMYLIKNYDATKISRMLMSLIVPFGYYQPYVWESANVMPPEIFIGRKRELESIKSPTGANIVYGGRQLGKSALLKKAKEDIDHNENGDRAVYIDIKGKDYRQAALKICQSLADEHILDEAFETDDWDQLARAVKKRLNSQSNKIHFLLLLLDEADAFIESSSSINFKPFDALKDIQSIGAGRFKFVVAGLRNVVKFKKEAALSNNSVLTHLQPLTVKPFDISDGRELMEVPLHYLGLRFPKEKESLITLILASTNYFPGLIQMYCAKLIEAMRNKDYAGYNEVNTPIYEISEEHIKKVLADSEFTEQIREKFFITLKLDEDNYYYLIALLMAYLYHNNGYSSGYSADDIKTLGTELGISTIAEMETYKLSALMDELMELNVLRRTDDDHYLFARFTFFQMLGTSNDLDDRLEKYMGV